MTDSEKATNGSNGDTATATTTPDPDVKAKILRQVEFYFGDFNLPRDRFLQEKMDENEGWIPMDTMLNFKRLATLSSDHSVILESLKESELMEIDLENKKIRRKPSLAVPEWNEERKKEIMAMTIYCKGFPKDDTLDEIMPYFEKLAPIQNVQLRMYVDKRNGTKGFKGSVFVTFKDKESAEKFMQSEDKLTYKDQDILKKWQEVYFEDKKKEMEEKKKERDDLKKSKLEKKKQKQKEQEAAEEGEAKQEISLPTGSVLHITGLNSETLREDIKAELEKFKIDPKSIAYIYYQKGDEEAKLRFKEENAGKEALEKLPEDGIEIKETKVSVKVLEGEEEESFLAQCVTDMENHKAKGKGHKRKGGFRGGRGGKRQRTN